MCGGQILVVLRTCSGGHVAGCATKWFYSWACRKLFHDEARLVVWLDEKLHSFDDENSECIVGMSLYNQHTSNYLRELLCVLLGQRRRRSI